MNLTEHVVTQVLEPPISTYDMWKVKVVANSWGREDEQYVYVKTKEEADSIAPGYRYDA